MVPVVPNSEEDLADVKRFNSFQIGYESRSIPHCEAV